MRNLLRFFLLGLLGSASLAQAQPVQKLQGKIDRPLRYRPDHGDFVIDNGTANFNRPLYTAHTAGRVDAGDRPEFAFLFPTKANKGGVLRLGITSAAGTQWLTAADHITARYRPGSMIYEIHDALLGSGSLTIKALPTQGSSGLVLRIQSSAEVNLLLAYGGGTGETSRNHYDLQDSQDLSTFWQWNPTECAGAELTMGSPGFTYKTKAGNVLGVVPADAKVSAADGGKWNDAKALADSTGTDQKVVLVRATISAGKSEDFAIIFQEGDQKPDAAGLFDRSEKYRGSIAGMVQVDSPDEYINAAAGAICIAADDIWQPPTFEHGANAWRTSLLGWRGPYALDALGWHDRALTQFSYWAAKQNTDPNIPTEAHADLAKNFAENDWVMLHSNGSIPQTHYDMNLPFIDELFWHFAWTGDVKFAKAMWPVITRHLAWEKRCFDRDGLYEGYACIWASDALEYNGGGAAHSSAYNYLHNTLAAKLAKIIGEDPAPYEKEAARIHDAMQKQLWLADRGWYGEYKDLLGLKRVHEDAALWSVYHVIDSRVPDAFQAYQMLRYVDTHIAHLPVQGKDVPEGNWYTLASTDWQPYQWSLNNVCLGENAHTALANFQAGRNEQGFDLFKGALLDCMYMGMCPGDLPNLSWYDVNRGESYRDFGDPTGITSRALVQGLFGIVPDAMTSNLTIQPGFPASWDHASIRMADVEYSFKRQGDSDQFHIESKFSMPMNVHLIWPARLDHVQSVTVNGQPAKWKNLDDSVGSPRIEIDALGKCDIAIQWAGEKMKETLIISSSDVHADFGAAKLLDFSDPQQAIMNLKKSDNGFTGNGKAGNHTVFAKISYGDLIWWMPVDLDVTAERDLTAEPAKPTHFQPVDLSMAYNDEVTKIFKNDYDSPRSPFCSLQIPRQGIGEWTSFRATANIDDRGLKESLTTPNGIPFTTGGAGKKNIAFTSQWDNYPHEISIPVSGKTSVAYLLMAGSTNPMETQIDNGEVVATYTDGTTAQLALRNPTNWWPIEQDYFFDDYSFKRPAPSPTRLRLSTGAFYTPRDTGGKVDGGAATVIDFWLDQSKELKSITVRTLSNTVVIGAMGITLGS